MSQGYLCRENSLREQVQHQNYPTLENQLQMFYFLETLRRNSTQYSTPYKVGRQGDDKTNWTNGKKGHFTLCCQVLIK